jgi:Fe-S-cluster containining protein
MEQFNILPGQNYDCVRCAKGCGQAWRIHVDPYSERKVSGTALELRVIEQHGVSFIKESEGSTLVARRPDGNCVFLGSDRLCTIHGELGVDAKPIGCRQFPFLIRPTPDGISVGVSFFCTAVQRNEGRPLEVHADEVREIMKGIAFKPIGDEPIPVYGAAVLHWPGYRAVERLLLKSIDESGLQFGIGRMILAMCRLITSQLPLEESDLEAAVESTEAGFIERDSIIRSQNEFFVANLIGMLEAPSPEQRRGLTEALLERRLVSLPRFGWQGTAMEIETRREALQGRMDGEIERYLRALVHRKFLALERPLLANLTVLYLLPDLLRTYTALASLARGADEADMDDYYRALDIVEIDLVTHVRGLEKLYNAVAEAFFNQIATLGG